jgi:hypothetical protein
MDNVRFQPDLETLRRLRDGEVSARAVAAEHDCSHTTVRRYLTSARGKRALAQLANREKLRERRARKKAEAAGTSVGKIQRAPEHKAPPSATPQPSTPADGPTVTVTRRAGAPRSGATAPARSA